MMLRRASLMACLVAVLSGCGNVGPPVAPETVGIGPRLELLEKQEAAERERAAQQRPVQPVEPAVSEGMRVVPEDEVPLPPLQPVGGR